MDPQLGQIQSNWWYQVLLLLPVQHYLQLPQFGWQCRTELQPADWDLQYFGPELGSPRNNTSPHIKNNAAWMSGLTVGLENTLETQKSRLTQTNTWVLYWAWLLPSVIDRKDKWRPKTILFCLCVNQTN